jgi:leader peptidase (prepilin peptidase)/N-methyltransferase
MSSIPQLFAGGAVGMAMGAFLIPLMRRELAAAVARSDEDVPGSSSTVMIGHWIALVVASGVVVSVVIARSGCSIRALPPLLLLMGLVQLGYCDITKFLLPKAMVHATTISVAIAAAIASDVTHDWHRLVVASSGGALLFLLLFLINLMNPAWMAFGDVRLAPAVGLGLGWIGPLALFQGFFLANVLAAGVGLALILVSKGSRKTSMPFGLYLAIASTAVIFLAT